MDSSKDWIDLTKDESSKIYKRVIRAGEIYYDKDLIRKSDEDLHPRRGDRVKVKLIGRTQDDQAFLCCENEPIEYNLFTGENIKGLDLVISSMIKNELCEASIAPEYVIEDVFCEHPTPKGKQLLYTIELLDWENEFLTRKNDGGVIRKLLSKGIGYEVPTVNTLVTVNLVAYYQESPGSCIVKFDDKTNLPFRLSEGSEVGIPRGLEYALYKMKLYEKNRVYVLKNYSFGLDCPSTDIHKLPENYYRIIYEIELISYQNEKQIWEMSLNERFDLCEREKNRGGEFFKQNKFHLALKCYSEILKAIGPPNTTIMQTDLTDQQKSTRNELIITIYNNMTLCYLKLKMPKEALKYATWCLQLDSNNVKAIYRSGLAHYDRNDFKQSIELFNRCLELDPNNKAALNQINQTQQQIKKYEDKEKQIFSNLFQALANDKEIQSMEF